MIATLEAQPPQDKGTPIVSDSFSPQGDASQAQLEIERAYLLAQLPAIPKDAVVHRIEQGYLPPDEHTADLNATGSELTEGRLRRTIHADGSVDCSHTIKHGEGLVRRELQRAITLKQFEQGWPRTAGRRLRKTRYLITAAPLVWEIDEFDELDLVLAEVELPSPDAKVTIPHWLAAHIVREVTEEPAYRNYNLAIRAAKSR